MLDSADRLIADTETAKATELATSAVNGWRRSENLCSNPSVRADWLIVPPMLSGQAVKPFGSPFFKRCTRLADETYRYQRILELRQFPQNRSGVP